MQYLILIIINNIDSSTLDRTNAEVFINCLCEVGHDSLKFACSQKQILTTLRQEQVWSLQHQARISPPLPLPSPVFPNSL